MEYRIVCWGPNKEYRWATFWCFSKERALIACQTFYLEFKKIDDTVVIEDRVYGSHDYHFIQF